MWENGTKGQRRTPGGPEMTFCAAASVSVSKPQIGWILTGTHTMQPTTPGGDPVSGTRRAARPPARLGVLHVITSELHIIYNYLGRAEGHRSRLTCPPPLIIIVVLRYVPAWNIQVSMILKVSLFYNLGQITFENADRMGACSNKHKVNPTSPLIPALIKH